MTVADVARRAGVSPMTVSRVVNGELSVRSATREAVELAVRELNYSPNLAARSLVTAEVRIGVIYSNPSSAFLSEFLVGVLDAAQVVGAQVVLVRSEEGDLTDLEAMNRLIRGGVTGVILLPPHSESDSLRAALADAQLPAAVVAPGRPVRDMICVRMDDEAAAFEVGRLLLALGHRRIGLIGGAPKHASSHARRKGLESAVGEVAGATIAFAQGHYDFESGLAAAEALLDRAERPTAIFASNDDMAAAAISVAHRRGMDVPGDLSVVGFDDTATALALWPPLTTVHQPVREMAASAVELLVLRVRGRDDGAPIDRVLRHDLINRQSVAPPLS